MSIFERLTAATPAFFKKLRAISLSLAAAGGAVLAAPVDLPAILTKVAGYLVVAGAVAGAVSQAAVEKE
ncbi:MAG: hypothetical protein JST39_07450 [Bacteroidetes bacterium]|nr:hypothetical protein [Bacteroidota bacterium]